MRAEINQGAIAQPRVIAQQNGACEPLALEYPHGVRMDIGPPVMNNEMARDRMVVGGQINQWQTGLRDARKQDLKRSPPTSPQAISVGATWMRAPDRPPRAS